jgi:hypothetical protein
MRTLALAFLRLTAASVSRCPDDLRPNTDLRPRKREVQSQVKAKLAAPYNRVVTATLPELPSKPLWLSKRHNSAVTHPTKIK